MNIKTEITKIHYNEDYNGFLAHALGFGSFFYGAASALKNLLYDKGLIKPKRVKAFVISVGNLTTGGVGKTPVVAELAKFFINEGKKVAIVSRGYGGKLSNKDINIISDGVDIFHDADMAGDEPFWLAENVEGAVVLTCKNKYRASDVAANNFGAEYIILDDGFQHRKLGRDLDIVLIDGRVGFGNGKLLPAGPLREGLESLKRANKLVIVNKGLEHGTAEGLAKVIEKKTDVKTSVCKVEPDIIYNIKTGKKLEKPSDITAVSAIGQPELFYEFLSGYNVRNKLSFDDHHLYSEDDLPEGIIVTTEKDAVKMSEFKRSDIYALKLKTVLDIPSLLN